MIATDELKPHEEVVESTVNKLVNAIQREGLLRDPLMVDKDDYVILDGMHRYNSLKRLNCRFIPCCLMDYNTPLIKVGAWFRLFTVDNPESLAERVLSNSNLKYSKLKTDAAARDDDTQTIILTKSGTTFSLTQPIVPLERAREAIALERLIVQQGHQVTYLSETVAIQKLASGEANFVVTLPVFSKDQIRAMGLKGQLLPHKVTRHVIPSRPLAFNVPLNLLTNPELSYEEADRKLSELLGKRRVDRKPAGSLFDGRRYEEELLIFSR
jgi:hypothetical protein